MNVIACFLAWGAHETRKLHLSTSIPIQEQDQALVPTEVDGLYLQGGVPIEGPHLQYVPAEGAGGLHLQGGVPIEGLHLQHGVPAEGAGGSSGVPIEGLHLLQHGVPAEGACDSSGVPSEGLHLLQHGLPAEGLHGAPTLQLQGHVPIMGEAECVQGVP